MDLAIALRTPQERIAACALSYNTMQPFLKVIAIGEETTFVVEGGKLLLPDGAVLVAQDAGEEDAILAQDREFVAAVREGRPPAVSAAAVLPAMAALQRIQDMNPHNPAR